MPENGGSGGANREPQFAVPAALVNVMCGPSGGAVVDVVDVVEVVVVVVATVTVRVMPRTKSSTIASSGALWSAVEHFLRDFTN